MIWRGLKKHINIACKILKTSNVVLRTLTTSTPPNPIHYVASLPSSPPSAPSPVPSNSTSQRCGPHKPTSTRCTSTTCIPSPTSSSRPSSPSRETSTSAWTTSTHSTPASCTNSRSRLKQHVQAMRSASVSLREIYNGLRPSISWTVIARKCTGCNHRSDKTML